MAEVPVGPVRRSPAAEPARRQVSRLALAVFLVGAGTLHFVIPSSYERIVPRLLGHARALVLVSGAAEVAVGVLVALPRTRRLGAWLAVGLLVAVFPANVQMAVDGGVPSAGFPLGSSVGAWLRLPLQVPLVLWALNHARRP
ncbi:MAG: DoxX family protein [Acidimicrobiales bacterium]